MMKGRCPEGGNEVCYCRHFGGLLGAQVSSSRACPEEAEVGASVKRGGKREEDHREKEEGPGINNDDGRARGGVGQE